MSFVCLWCILAGTPEAEAKHKGTPPAYDENTGDPICPDHAAEQDDMIDSVFNPNSKEES